MYELRQGLGVLAEADARERLRSCDKTAIREVAGRLRKRWSEADIQTLLLEWRKLKGGTHESMGHPRGVGTDNQ